MPKEKGGGGSWADTGLMATPRAGRSQEPAALIATCHVHGGQSPPSYRRLSVLLWDAAAAPGMEPGQPDPGIESCRWDGFAGPQGTPGKQQCVGGVRERAGEQASEPRSGLTGFTGSRRKLCEHDCAGPSLPPAASRHSTPKRAGPVGTSLKSPRPASLEMQKAFDE